MTGRRLIDTYKLDRPRRSYPMHAVSSYRHDGIKELACAVIRLAAEDATGRRWSETLRCFLPIKVPARRKRTAVDFINGRTRGPGRMNCFEFVCMLANVDADSIRRGVSQ